MRMSWMENQSLSQIRVQGKKRGETKPHTVQQMMMMKRRKEKHQRRRRNVTIKNRRRIPSLLKHSRRKSGLSRSVVLPKLLLETALSKPKGKVVWTFIQQKLVPVPPRSLSLIMNQPVMVLAMSFWRSEIPQRKYQLRYQRKDPL